MSAFSVPVRRAPITSPVTLCLSHMNDALTCRVLACVSAMTGVRVRDMLGGRKTADVAWARHLAMRLMFDQGGIGLREVAIVFGRHHTTVLHALKAVQDRASIYAGDRETLKHLRRHLGL